MICDHILLSARQSGVGAADRRRALLAAAALLLAAAAELPAAPLLAAAAELPAAPLLAAAAELPAAPLLAAAAELPRCPRPCRLRVPKAQCCCRDNVDQEDYTYDCQLTTGPVRVKLSSDLTKLTFDCERKDTELRCEKVQEYLIEELENFSASDELRILRLERCSLAEPLSCAGALAGGRPRALELRAVRSPLRPHHLHGLAPLRRLTIDEPGPAVDRVPYDALDGLNLNTLEIKQGCKLRLVEQWQPPLPSLEVLDLSNNGIESIPPRAFDGLPNLRALTIWGGLNTLNELSFEGLAKLENLSLCGNGLESLPPGLLNATSSLRKLHLLRNHLQSLPGNLLNHLKYLKEVKISNGKGEELELEEHTFAGLDALQSLSLEKVGLRALPAALLAPARALRRLSLTYNHLRNIPVDAFANLTHLLTLDLSHNDITELEPGVFEGLVSLEELSLSSNRLGLELAAVAALGLPRALRRVAAAHNAARRLAPAWRDLRLDSLDLSHNEISKLTDTDLLFMSQTIVNLRDNKISQVIPVEPTKPNFGFSNASFSLEGNPFNCDCNMYEFLAAHNKSLEFRRRIGQGSARCAAPPDLAGTALRAVDLARLQCSLPAPACPRGCHCTVRPHAALLALDCAAVPAAAPPPARYGVAHVALRLRGPAPDLRALSPDVRLVDLSGLNLTVAPAARACDRLTVDLSRNALTEAPRALLEAACTVRLAGNGMMCDCDHRDSIALLQLHWNQIEDREHVRCHDAVPVSREFEKPRCEIRDAGSIGGYAAAAVLVSGAIAVLVIRYSLEIRLALRKVPWLAPLFDDDDDPLGPERRYDAFVSFSHHDDDFVRDELVPRLEGGRRPLRLCVHYRDWEVGGLIPEQVDRSVRESRRTIVVLSAAFLESGWGRVEFRAAHALRRVVLVVRGEVPAARADRELRAYLASHTYVRADDPRVWERVRAAVRRRSPRDARDRAEDVAGAA
ncbi:uncharacterized protein [Epargyreus clarus]|uniref:uncharacterized protein n=1 Tax=Epargyreus clarus TaxID=520877 RepID=UPI003C301EAE